MVFKIISFVKYTHFHYCYWNFYSAPDYKDDSGERELQEPQISDSLRFHTALLSVRALQLLLALRPGERPSLPHQRDCSLQLIALQAGDFPCRRCRAPRAPHYYQLQQKVMVLAQYLRPAWLHRSRHSWQYCAGRRVTIVVGAGDTRKHTEVGKDWGRHGGGRQAPNKDLLPLCHVRWR